MKVGYTPPRQPVDLRIDTITALKTAGIAVLCLIPVAVLTISSLGALGVLATNTMAQVNTALIGVASIAVITVAILADKLLKMTKQSRMFAIAMKVFGFIVGALFITLLSLNSCGAAGMLTSGKMLGWLTVGGTVALALTYPLKVGIQKAFEGYLLRT